MVDVEQLRADARERAAQRLRAPFDGTIRDDQMGVSLVRWYVPRKAGASSDRVVFLHGGYGIFGDLDLQDNYCRELAQTLARIVVAVDYRLAPEHEFGDSVTDAVTVVDALREAGARRVYCCGDSAGGAVALAAALTSPGAVDGLLLTNPNVDLTLSSFDIHRPGGPNLETSRYAFRAWTRAGDLTDAPSFQAKASSLPPTFVAVGEQDCLMPECQALIEACAHAGVPAELLLLQGVGHGLMGHQDLAVSVLDAMRSFVCRTSAPYGQT